MNKICKPRLKEGKIDIKALIFDNYLMSFILCIYISKYMIAQINLISPHFLCQSKIFDNL